MEKGNGKIAIAIVAMLVVALSIVGVTYAYFVASVQGNTNPAEKVEVQAGMLEVTYQDGDEISATNIVPGWASDGDSYYDPVASAFKVSDTVTGIKAVKASEDKFTDGTNLQNTKSITSNHPVTPPATFSVRNSGDSKNSAYYAIKLVDVVNGLVNDTDAAGEQNLTVTLYKGEWTEGMTAEQLASLEVDTYTLTTGEEQFIGGVYQTDGTELANFFIIVRYAEDGNEQDSDSVMTVSAKVKVVGLHNKGTAGAPVWVDAVGTTIQASELPSNTPIDVVSE